MIKQLGLVVIGRNEGDLLRQCLLSAIAKVAHIVYVDSGSTDDSVSMARLLGVDVVEMNMSQAFTAGRARNEGFWYLISKYPNIQLVQFVDGDCEIVAQWLETAQETLENQANLAIACGRRRERFPEKSIYNRLCDLEWDTPIGETKACGGDFMVKVSAFQQIQGFNPALIAGEEPELCIRLRQQGWKILRIDADMTLHDARMSSISQWWRRALRGGYAYAEGSWIHGGTAERHWVKESRSIWFWGLVLPLLILVMLLPTSNLSLLLLAGYILVIGRIYLSLNRRLDRLDAWLYSIHCVMSKFPQTQGQLKFHLGRLRGKASSLIEYKSPSVNLK
jgi:GT2 family glycosyltransferase